ncbi:FAD-binding oxidoreductase [bacterium]|nr:FAD-binding oxidoreductase [bacterium]
MSRHFFVIGCGQFGAALATRLLGRGYGVTVLDDGFGADRQTPWGWFRRATLQPRSRQPGLIEPMCLPFTRKGPMIISSSRDASRRLWQQWLDGWRGNTDARLLTRQERDEFAIRDRHAILCDSRDFLLDFSSYHAHLMERIHDDRRAVVIPSRMRSFGHRDRTVTRLVTETGNGLRVDDRDTVVFALGNQTTRFFSYPILRIRLPFMDVAPAAGMPSSGVLAWWNETASIQHHEGFTRIGCGLQGRVDALPELRYWHRYMSFLGKTRYAHSGPDVPARLLRAAFTRLGLPPGLWRDDAIRSCVVDATPAFRPIVDFWGRNALVVHGFSGSGFTAHEDWFLRDILDSLENHHRPVPRLRALAPLFSRDDRSFLY